MYRILSATGFATIEKELKTIENCTVIGSVYERKKLTETVRRVAPDILIISDYLPGKENMIKLLIDVHREFPSVRIIYLAQSLSEKNTAQVDAFGALVLNGIYDIIHEDTITIELIEDVITHPKTERSVQYLTERILGEEAQMNANENGFHYEQVEEVVDYRLIQNLTAVSSIKPGSGKSFVSVNLATAIAKYGKNKPKVALVEADLQNLSVGTLLKVEDNKRNLKVALQAINGIIKDGKIIASVDDTQIVNETIRDCMLPYGNMKNFDVMVGSQLTFNDVNGDFISADNFIYLIEVISRLYDVVVVDTNSSLFHLSTMPVLKRAKECYYIINLDYNNIRNNVKYQEVFKTLGIQDKIKYVLNESFDNSEKYKAMIGSDCEKLMFTQETIENKFFKLEGTIPALPKTVFLNRLYAGTPVVLDEKKEYTAAAKLALLEIANKIYPIDEQYITQLQSDVAAINGELPDETSADTGIRVYEKKEGFFARLFSKKRQQNA